MSTHTCMYTRTTWHYTTQTPLNPPHILHHTNQHIYDLPLTFFWIIRGSRLYHHGPTSGDWGKILPVTSRTDHSVSGDLEEGTEIDQKVLLINFPFFPIKRYFLRAVPGLLRLFHLTTETTLKQKKTLRSFTLKCLNNPETWSKDLDGIV